MRLRLQTGVRVEEIDGETIVLDSAGSLVHRVTGESVEALRLALQGINDSELPAHLSLAMASLVDAGVVGPAGWSRRKLLAAGGVGVAAATVTSFALASPAAAVSCVNGTPTTIPATYTASGTFFTGRYTNITVQMWGAGGQGGGGASQAGGGGGGGAYTTGNISVAQCTSYNVTVGSGGAAGSQNSNGTAGGPSSFVGLTTLSANGGAGGSTGGAGGAGGTGGTFPGGGGATVTGASPGGGGGGSAGAGPAGPGGAGTGATAGAAGAGTPSGAAGGAGGNGGVPPSPGNAPGGGGGGGEKSGGATKAGGAGARGEVRVTAKF